LRQTQGTIRTETPNWQPWLMFFMRALQQQKRRLAENVELEKTVIASLPDLAVFILDYARKTGCAPMEGMLEKTGASRNTLKEHFRNLVEKKLLVHQGAGRAATYVLPCNEQRKRNEHRKTAITSLLEQLPKNVADGKREAERIMERLESNYRITQPASTFWRRISTPRQEHQVGRFLGIPEKRLARRA
jgi:hypothetical protein